MGIVSTNGSPFGYAAGLQPASFRRDQGSSQSQAGPPPARPARPAAESPPAQAAQPDAVPTAIAGRNQELVDPYAGVISSVFGNFAYARADGGQPALTEAETQQIAAILERHRGERDITALFVDLWAHGLHPSQIAERAQAFVLPSGVRVSAAGARLPQVVNLSA